MSHIPRSTAQAMCDPNWKRAMDSDMSALLSNHTWTLIPCLYHSNISLFARDILERADMSKCNFCVGDFCTTPTDTKSKLSSLGTPISNPTLYRSLAGALRYLTITCPDISYAVQQVCHFMHDPHEPHMDALKRILRYLQGTMYQGLFIRPSSVDRLCMGVANVVAEAAWLRNLLLELLCPLQRTTVVFCDNKDIVNQDITFSFARFPLVMMSEFRHYIVTVTDDGVVIWVFTTRPKLKKNMLPEPWRLPIIGHMHHLIGTLPHRGTLKLAKKYGSLMHLQLGEVSTIVVTSLRWAKEVLIMSDIVFANRPETLTGKFGSPISLSKNIFMLIATILSREAFGEGFKEQKASLEMLHEIGKSTGGFDVADIFPTKKILHHLSGKIDNVKVVIVDTFSANTDSSSATIEWAISELIRCPRAMEKLQKELRQELNGKEWIQEEDIIELSYLKAVIKETLRLHPPLAMSLPRERREPCVLGGYEIPTRTKLIVNVFAINRDPEYWQDAETFMPERFKNSSINIMGSEYEYLLFGAGRRMCLAYNLGFANMELPLATLLYYN
uniref:Germacrene A oxidase-like n=1 Tax=Tanacetum cinerariifolium TaxID=118510 RepID=A0A6L2LHF2_TANCI|nr:germacrene A oxidase-like [Tanacetum cinerariifolium]